jgi:hypothetical protein
VNQCAVPGNPLSVERYGTTRARLRLPAVGLFLRPNPTRRMMTALASLMGARTCGTTILTRARSHQPGAFHLLFSISRAPCARYEITVEPMT